MDMGNRFRTEPVSRENEAATRYSILNECTALPRLELQELVRQLVRRAFTSDSGNMNLAEEVNYQEEKEAFYGRNGLHDSSSQWKVFDAMLKESGRSRKQVYLMSGLEKSSFSKLRKGVQKTTRKLLVAFSVNMGLTRMKARILFEAFGLVLTHQDAVNIEGGQNGTIDYMAPYETPYGMAVAC